MSDYKKYSTSSLLANKHIRTPLYITHVSCFMFQTYCCSKLSDISRKFSVYNLARVEVTTVTGNNFQLGEKNNSHFKIIKEVNTSLLKVMQFFPTT